MIYHFHEPWPISKEKASFFLRHKIFSVGGDFSHGRRLQSVTEEPSFLHRLWLLDESLEKWCESVGCWWMEEEGRPIAIVVSVDIKTAHKHVLDWPLHYRNHWMAFTLPTHRKKGYMRALLHHVFENYPEQLNLEKDKISAEGGLKNYLDTKLKFRSCPYWTPSVAKTSWMRLHWGGHE